MLLEAQRINKHFSGVTALDDVVLEVQERRVHSIIGPNGAGKSTLVNVLTGRITPDSGTVVFDGNKLNGRSPHEISQLGISRVFQSPEIFPDLSVEDNVLAGALAARDGSFRFNLLQHPHRLADATEAAQRALTEVNLDRLGHVRAENLSRGDKRRLELAVCLACRPRLLLLDEPTAGMSPSETHATVDLLHQIADRGVSMVVIEHDMEVVFSLSQHLTVLHQGRVIADGTPAEIRENEEVHEAYLGGVTLE
jgi:branched-chain amino acid transport system ATP-binding protein